MRRSRKHWLVLLAAAGAAAALAVGVLVLEPDPRGYGTHEQLGMRPCASMALLGVPCPGCGVTTSVTHAVHGELAASLAAQPFGLAVALVLVLFPAWAALGLVRGRDLWKELRRLPLVPLGVAALVLATVAWAYKLLAVLA